MDTIFLALGVAMIINVALSGFAGAVLARRRGLPLRWGVAPGVLLPWLGLILPAAMRPSGPLPVLSKPAGRRRVVGLALAGSGLIGVVLSAFWEWAKVWGVINAPGQRFVESVSGGPGDTPFGLVVLLLTVALSAAMLAGHIWHGGLRFSVPGLCIGGVFASLTIFGVLASEVVSDVSSAASRLTAGHAEARVELGLGAMFAALGSALLCVGWVVTMGGRTVHPVDPARMAQAPGALPGAAAVSLEEDPWAGSQVTTAVDPWAQSPLSMVDPWARSPQMPPETLWTPNPPPGGGAPSSPRPEHPPEGW